MLQNFFKTAWRSLNRNKFYSVINMAGLSVGLAVGMLILFWVRDELSFDGFHHQAQNIYKLENRVGTGSSIQIWHVTNRQIAPEAKKQLGEVKDFVRITQNYFFQAYKYQGKTFAQNRAFFTDPAFFSVLDFHLIQGNGANPFPTDNSVVMTESASKKYFGDQDPMGKVISGDDKSNFTVSGIIRDFPTNSTIQGDLFFPISYVNQVLHPGKTSMSLDEEWENFSFTTFLLLQPGTSIPKLAEKLKAIHLKFEPADTDIVYLPYRITKMHLYKADGSPGGIETVRIFAVIALLILGIACVNYVNLSTARSMSRAREVSLRKIVGADRLHLFAQFLVETGFLFVLAAWLAIGLMYALMPLFNRISGKSLVMDLEDYHFWMIILISVVSSLLISSIYPALLLSSFEPIKTIRGKMTAGIRDSLFRKILVVGQFTVSVALMTGTMVITRQMNYIRSKNLGYDKENVFSFYMRNAPEHYGAIRDELMKTPGILDVTCSSANIVQLGELTGDNHWEGKEASRTFMMYPFSVDKNYIPFFKLELVQGNNFSGAANDSAHFILNETAVREAGIRDPVGKQFTLRKMNGTIIGVVKDFHFASMKQKIEPAILYYRPAGNGTVFVKTRGKDADKAIAATRKAWNQYNADQPFSYAFMDETFENLYRTEQRSGLLVSAFAVIAILISCLGLLGLAAYTAQVRTREIGVRKVLGSSVASITKLLASDFIKLVLAGILIATPISWWIMNKWLDDFAYRTSLGWAVFSISGLLAAGIAIITISFQSVKAALSNPVECLRAE